MTSQNVSKHFEMHDELFSFVKALVWSIVVPLMIALYFADSALEGVLYHLTASAMLSALGFFVKNGEKPSWYVVSLAISVAAAFAVTLALLLNSYSEARYPGDVPGAYAPGGVRFNPDMEVER